MSDKSVAGRMAILALTLSAGHLACAPERAGNHVAPVITGPVDETQLVVLPGNTRPEALRPAYDQGKVADSFTAEHVQLLLQRSPATEHALETAIEALQKPGSPTFHKWMSAQEVGDQYGLADSDLAAITGFLASHGLRVNNINTARTMIDFSGTAAQITSAFHTELHALNVNGALHVSNVSDPQIPAALQPAVVGVVSLNDFRPHNQMKPRANYSAGGGYQVVVPADLATIYNLNPLFTAGTSGQGQTVVVIEDTDVYSTDDWNTFRTVFGLDTYTQGSFTEINPQPASGASNCIDPGVNGAESEAILDAEWATAAAPSASIVLASCADTAFNFGGLIAVDNLLNESIHPPSIMSISYGTCETENGAAQNAAYKTVFQQGAAEGVSIFVSAGDSGAAGCDQDFGAGVDGIAVSGFASTPYNVAVGGTDFGDTAARQTPQYWSTHNTATYGSALSYVPEIPWNDSCASTLLASFNGSSTVYGSSGYCNSVAAEKMYLTTAAGSGGPSGCATGSPATPGVVSGSCRGYAKPAWQALIGNPDDGVRDIPDVSLFAANGIWEHLYVFCDSDPSDGTGCGGAPNTWPGAGGTSFASPIMAGIQSLVNQKHGPQGNPNQTYYAIAATEYGASGNPSCSSTEGNKIGSTCSFNDVTSGDIDVNCSGPFSCYTPSGANGVLSTDNGGYGPAFASRTGWDFATGIGTVNANNLVNNSAWSAGTTNLSWAPPHQ